MLDRINECTLHTLSKAKHTDCLEAHSVVNIFWLINIWTPTVYGVSALPNYCKAFLPFAV